MLALVTRLLLLCGLAFMVKLTKPLFEIPTFGILSEPHGVSGRDLILRSSAACSCCTRARQKFTRSSKAKMAK